MKKPLYGRDWTEFILISCGVGMLISAMTLVLWSVFYYQ